MPQSENYIKTRSRRELRRLIKNSNQIILKAGTNDIDNQPGSTTSGNPIRNETGVPQPGEYAPEVQTNKIVSETGRITSSSFGSGNVEQPPADPKKPLNSTNQIYYPPYVQSQTWRDRTLLNDAPSTIADRHTTVAGEVDQQPFGTNNAGELSKEPERTVGLDGNRIVRERTRRRKQMSRGE